MLLTQVHPSERHIENTEAALTTRITTLHDQVEKLKAVVEKKRTEVSEKIEHILDSRSEFHGPDFIASFEELGDLYNDILSHEEDYFDKLYRICGFRARLLKLANNAKHEQSFTEACGLVLKQYKHIESVLAGMYAQALMRVLMGPFTPADENAQNLLEIPEDCVPVFIAADLADGIDGARIKCVKIDSTIRVQMNLLTDKQRFVDEYYTKSLKEAEKAKNKEELKQSLKNLEIALALVFTLQQSEIPLKKNDFVKKNKKLQETMRATQEQLPVHEQYDEEEEGVPWRQYLQAVLAWWADRGVSLAGMAMELFGDISGQTVDWCGKITQTVRAAIMQGYAKDTTGSFKLIGNMFAMLSDPAILAALFSAVLGVGVSYYNGCDQNASEIDIDLVVASARREERQANTTGNGQQGGAPPQPQIAGANEQGMDVLPEQPIAGANGQPIAGANGQDGQPIARGNGQPIARANGRDGQPIAGANGREASAPPQQPIAGANGLPEREQPALSIPVNNMMGAFVDSEVAGNPVQQIAEAAAKGQRLVLPSPIQQSALFRLLSYIPTADKMVAYSILYPMMQISARAIRMLTGLPPGMRAATGILGIIAMAGMSPVLASIIPVPVLVDAAVWLGRGVLAHVSPLNLGHLDVLALGMKHVAKVAGLAALSNGLHKVVEHMDSGNESVRCAIFALGAGLYKTIYGPPASPKALATVEPFEAVDKVLAQIRSNVQSPAAANMLHSMERVLQKVKKTEWQQIHPLSILQTLWPSSGWNSSMLLGAAKQIILRPVSSMSQHAWTWAKDAAMKQALKRVPFPFGMTGVPFEIPAGSKPSFFETMVPFGPGGHWYLCTCSGSDDAEKFLLDLLFVRGHTDKKVHTVQVATAKQMLACRMGGKKHQDPAWFGLGWMWTVWERAVVAGTGNTFINVLDEMNMLRHFWGWVGAENCDDEKLPLHAWLWWMMQFVDVCGTKLIPCLSMSPELKLRFLRVVCEKILSLLSIVLHEEIAAAATWLEAPSQENAVVEWNNLAIQGFQWKGLVHVYYLPALLMGLELSLSAEENLKKCPPDNLRLIALRQCILPEIGKLGVLLTDPKREKTVFVKHMWQLLETDEQSFITLEKRVAELRDKIRDRVKTQGGDANPYEPVQESVIIFKEGLKNLRKRFTIVMSESHEGAASAAGSPAAARAIAHSPQGLVASPASATRTYSSDVPTGEKLSSEVQNALKTMMPAAAREFLAKSNEYKARQIETREKNEKKSEQPQQKPPRQWPLSPNPHKAAAKGQPKVVVTIGDAKSVAEMMQKAFDFSKEQQQQQQQIGNESSRKGKEQASVQPASNTRRTLQFSAAVQEPQQQVSFEDLVVSMVEYKVLSSGGKEMVELLACVDGPKFSDDNIVTLAVFACREYFANQPSQGLAMVGILGEQSTMQGIMRSVPQPVASFFIEKAYIHVAGLLLDSVVALAATDKGSLPWWLQPDMLAECEKAAEITENAEKAAAYDHNGMLRITEEQIKAAKAALQAAEEAKERVFQPRQFPCLANIALLKEIRRLPYCRMQSALAPESEAAGTKRGRETVQDNMALLFADDSLRNISNVRLQQENSKNPQEKKKAATKLAEWVRSVPTPQNPAAMAGLVFPHKHPIYSPHVLLGNVLARLHGRPWAQAHLLHTFASTKADEDSENPIFESIVSVVLNDPKWKNNPLLDEASLQQQYNGTKADKRVTQYAEYLQRCFGSVAH